MNRFSILRGHEAYLYFMPFYWVFCKILIDNMHIKTVFNFTIVEYNDKNSHCSPNGKRKASISVRKSMINNKKNTFLLFFIKLFFYIFKF
jgi:hypothetical protein